MQTGEIPTLMHAPGEPITTHEACSWNVHRATLLEYAHEVGGVRYVGGVGQRLDELLGRAWASEARQLTEDLIVAMAWLPDEVLRHAVSLIEQAAETTIAMRVPVEVVPERPRRRRDTGSHDAVQDDAVTALERTAVGHEGSV